MSGFLLDTPVLSELVKPAPQPSVVSWVDAHDELSLHVSVLTIGELQKGISKLVPSHRQTALQRWINEDLIERFHGRILPVDNAVATQWGRIAGTAERTGSRLPAIDVLIASTASVHGLAVVTRNVRDLGRFGVPVIDPWHPAAG